MDQAEALPGIVNAVIDFFFLPVFDGYYEYLAQAWAQALNCRTEGGPKANELKSVYQTCLKKQEGRNSSDVYGYSDEQDRKDQRGHSKFSPKKQWNRDGVREMDDRMRDRNDRDDKNDERDGRTRDRNDRMGGRDGMNDRGERSGGRDNMNRNNNEGREQFSGRYDSPQNEEYGDLSHYNGYHSTTQPSRRFKRSKRGEMNSGQRSQYNPNSRKQSEYEGTYRDDERNSSNASRDAENKMCALHCFMEKLEMTGDDGMPDRYLVTHAITKDVKNEDLKDFLQESIEECFQILDNENTEEKCEFSKNLMTCLSEKGKANCDDWKDDLQF